MNIPLTCLYTESRLLPMVSSLGTHYADKQKPADDGGFLSRGRAFVQWL